MSPRIAAFSLFTAIMLGSVRPALPAWGQNAGITFSETGHTIRGRFLDYWQQHGGLAQNGYPLTEEFQELSPSDGQTYTVQYFERAIFELHPKNKPPYDVLLSRLGALRYQARYPTQAPGQHVNTENPRRFPQTGHAIGGLFRTYWEQHGGLAQYGYPISDEFSETSDLDGKSYTVQYFERAVFEYHAENPPPYTVLLTQLGRFRQIIRQAKQTAAGLPSPPRIYGPGAGETALWPDSAGSVVTSYSTCGVQPLRVSQSADACEEPIVLTTQLALDAPTWRVTFLASWANDTRQHRWIVRVSGDGTATLLLETGDRLPILPQAAGPLSIAGSARFTASLFI